MIPPPDPVIDAIVRKSVENAPPLTEDQINRIAILLRPVSRPADYEAAA